MGDTEYEWTGTGPKVVVLGDSLTVGSRTELRDRLHDVSLKIAAHFGEGLAGGPISTTLDTQLMESAARVYRADPPEVVVMALGTNDAWIPELLLEDAIAGWATITAQFEDACLVGVTVTENAKPEKYNPAQAEIINEMIRDRSDQVVDWAELGTAAELLLDDQIHLSDKGKAHRSDLITSAVHACLGR